MLSEARRSARSPSESVQTESVRTGPTTGVTGRVSSRRSSITEEDEPRKIPPAPPLPPTARSPTKSSSSSSTSSTPTQASSKPTVVAANAIKTGNQTSFQKPTVRHVSSDEKKHNGRRVSDESTKRSEPKQTTTGNLTRVSMRDVIDDQTTAKYATQLQGEKPNKSIFEKVDTHNGHTSYLGSGTFTQLENCLRNCLSNNQSPLDIISQPPRHHSPHKGLTRASVLDDYSYDGISAPKHQAPLPNDSYHHVDHHAHHHSDHHYSNPHHHHRADHPKSAAELSLIEIREVNDALAKYGIPVFSHQPNPYDAHQKPHSIGEIMSACRLLLEEPRLGLNRDGSPAVQHAWNALQHQQPPTNNHGYASPAVRGVASHLFNQPPYDPVHSVASHLFGPPQQHPYNPVQGVASHLFSGQPQYGAPSSFSHTFNQYPGNNPYPY